MTYIRRAILALVLIAGFSPAIAQVPAAVPALPDTERRTSYSITASACACAVNFALYGDSTDYQNWVEVFINGTRVNYNDATYGWTITSPSGSLTNLARPITNAVLTFNAVQTGTVQIVGARRPRRTSQFNENAGVPTRNFNQVLTDIIAQNREIWDKTNDVTGRAIMAPPGETLNILAKAAARANAVLGFDALGQIALYSPGSSVTTSANVTFLQYGTGAASRTAQAKMRETFSVLDFAMAGGGNCVANLVSDCTLAINAAIQAAYDYTVGNTTFGSNATVYLPAGPSCYKTNSTINLLKNINLRGDGTGSCILASNTDGITLNYISGFGQPTISDLLIYGIGATAGRTAIKAPGTNNSGDSLYGLSIRNVKIFNFDTAISLKSALTIWITNIFAQNVNRCIEIIGWSGIAKIEGNECAYGTGGGTGITATTGISVLPYTYADGTLSPEGIEIQKTGIVNFKTGLDIQGVGFLTFNSSDISATVDGIKYKNAFGGLYINNNYIALISAAGAHGIYADGTTGTTENVTNIHSNTFISSTSTNSVGILINDVSGSGNTNVNISKNLFSGFTLRDIQAFGANQINVEGNWAKSTGVTDSINFGAATAGSVNLITNNKTAAAIVAIGTDLTSGIVRKCNNVVAGVTEACSWGVETNSTTAGQLMVGGGAGVQPTGLTLGAGMTTWIGTPSSANLRATVTDETGTGLLYFQGGDIGTPSAGVGTNLTALNASNLSSGTIPNARIVNLPTNTNLSFSSDKTTSLVAASTWFLGLSVAAATENVAAVPLSAPGTIKNLYCSTLTGPGGVTTYIATMRKNASSQTLTCTMTGAATACNNTANSFSAVAGDLLDLQLVTLAGAATAVGFNCSTTLVTTSP